MKSTILVTGAAGFIGFHVVKKLLTVDNVNVIGLDNLNHYYDVRLKLERLNKLGINSYKIAMGMNTIESVNGNFKFIKIDLVNKKALDELFVDSAIDTVIHLAAQAGVRHSIENPSAYIDSNIVGFSNLLEEARKQKLKHFIFASSSSVYGLNKNIPFNTEDKVDYPISLYAATKKSNELIAHAYSHIHEIPVTGLRFFTVYGPWGRPDMAYFLFVKAILEGKPIRIFNNGLMARDFTYIDDIVEGIIRTIDLIPKELSNDVTNSKAKYKIYNIGNNAPVSLLKFVETIEQELNIKAKKEMCPMQPGDVAETFADSSNLIRDISFRPKTSLNFGIKEFVKWYRHFYNV